MSLYSYFTNKKGADHIFSVEASKIKFGRGSLKEIGDITWRRGAIRFKGTEEQLDAFLDTLIQDETYFKYRNCFTIEEYNNLERIPIL